MPPRLYLPPDHLHPPVVSLPPDAAHYLRQVLRLADGDEFVVFDGSGQEYSVVLESGPRGRIVHVADRAGETAPHLRLTLYQGLPKGKKLPLIIQKVTELGAARLVPVQTARSVVQVAEEKSDPKRQRWQKIADEAAEQSQRLQPLQVAPVMDWDAALRDWQQSGAPGLLPDEMLAGAAEQGLRRVWSELGSPAALSVFIGPEGGLSPAEAAQGREAGLRPVSLGPRILRTETAAIVVCALLLYEAGDLG